MSQIIDGRGSEITLYTRRGADLQFELDLDTTDLTGYSVRFLVGAELVPTLIVGATILMTLPHTLTATLLPAVRYSVSITAPDEVLSPLVYGALFTSDWLV